MDEPHGSDTPQKTQYMSFLYQGSELLLSNRLSEAKEVLEKAAAIDRDDPKGLSLLGLIYYRLAEYEQAREVYQKLVDLFPNEASLRVNLGLVYMMQGHTESAVYEMQRAIAADPHHQRAHVYLGHLYAELGDHEAARREFVRAGQNHLARRMEQVSERSLPGDAFADLAAQDMEQTPSPIPDEEPTRPVETMSGQRKQAITEELPATRVGKRKTEKKTAPAEAVPAEPTPAEPLPVEPEPARAKPKQAEPPAAKPEPAQPVTEQARPAPDEPSPAEPAPAEPAPVEPVTEQARPAPDEPSPAEPAPAEPVSEQAEPTVEESIAPAPTAVDPVALPQGAPVSEPQVASAEQFAERTEVDANGPAAPFQPSPSADEVPVGAIPPEPPDVEIPALDQIDVRFRDLELPAQEARTEQKGSEPIFAFATSNLLDPSSGIDSLRTTRQGLLLSPLKDEAFLRETGLVFYTDQMKFEPARKRFRGQTSEQIIEDEGLGRMLRIRGQGLLTSSPGEGRFTVIELFDDFIYLRQHYLFAFEPSLYWENGRIRSQEAELPLVLLRGEGRLAIWTPGEILKVRVVPDREIRLPADELVGWVGRLIAAFDPQPEGPSSARTPHLCCHGEGVILMNA